MRIDESRRDDHSSCIDRARGTEIRFARVANKYNSVTANADICLAGFASGTVNQLSVNNQNVELIRLSTRDWAGYAIGNDAGQR
jgi:hypothetical protein